MQQQLPEDLKEARDLFDRAEKEAKPLLRIRALEDAVDILNSHLEFEPGSRHRAFIENIKVTYTRKVLEELPALFGSDIDIWFGYITWLFLKVPKEVEVNIQANPQLKGNYDKFIEIWREEAMRLLGRRIGG